MRRHLLLLMSVLSFLPGCMPGCALHANAIYATDAADDVNEQLTTYLFDADPEKAATALAPTAPPDWISQAADIRRMIDQSCGVITEARPVESAMNKSGPQMLDLLYDVTSSRGPCYLRVVVGTPSLGKYVLRGVFLRMQRYDGMLPVTGAKAVTRPATAPTAEVPVEPDTQALSRANAFVADLIVKPDARAAWSVLTPSGQRAFTQTALQNWSTQATAALGQLDSVRPARFLRLSHQSTFVYEVVGSQKSGSVLVAIGTSSNSMAVAGFQTATGGVALQPGMDLPKAFQVDLDSP